MMHAIMRIISGGTTSEVYGGRFTGAVRLEMLDEAPVEGAPDIARVTFDVDTEPMHRHYHGAAPGHACTFLAITWGTTEWEDNAP